MDLPNSVRLARAKRSISLDKGLSLDFRFRAASTETTIPNTKQIVKTAKSALNCVLPAYESSSLLIFAKLYSGSSQFDALLYPD